MTLRTAVSAARFATLFGCLACGSSHSASDDAGTPGELDAGPDASSSEDAGVDSSVVIPPPRCADRPSEGTLRRLDAVEYTRSYTDLVGVAPMAPLSSNIVDLRQGAPRERVVSALDVEAIHQNAVQARSLAPRLASTCDPILSRRECAAHALRAFGPAVLRRPLDDIEVASYMDLFDSAEADGLAAVIEALFLSPYFVFHVELGLREDAGTGQPVHLTAHELASRISFTLFGTSPNATLAAHAEAGETDDAAFRQAFAERAFTDGDAAPGVRYFHRLWLGYSDDARLPSFAAETDAFVSHIVFEGDGRLESLTTSAFSFLDDTLAVHYGVPAPSTAFGRVELDPDRFSSLLTHGSFLSRYQSISTRGVWALETLLCQEVPPPPPDVHVPDALPSGETERERLAAAVSSSAACAACHNLFDGLGVAFLGFDGEGRPRDTEAGHPIDDAGEWMGSTFDGAPELAALLAHSPDARACVTDRFMTYALRRRIDRRGGDTCSFEYAHDAYSIADGSIRALVSAHVGSAIFEFRAPLPARMTARPPSGDSPLDHATSEAYYLAQNFPDEERTPLRQYVDALRDLRRRLR